MKNYIKYSLVCTASVFLLGSCSDVMDTKPMESYDEALVWSSSATADAFALGVYNDVVGYYTGSGAWEALTPNGIQSSQVSRGEGHNGTVTEEDLSASTDYGFGRFGQLRSCNKLIEKATASTSLSESKRKELVAEGRLLRGMLFFDMTRKMGRFVPIREVLSVEDKEAMKLKATANVAESYKLVMEDLTAACEGMPETSAVGRANKYAAHLIRSRAALQAYAYTGDASYLDLAITSAQAVIERYPLTSDYASMFNQSASGGEIVWAKYYLAEAFSVGSTADMVRVAPNVSTDDNTNAQCPRPLKNAKARTFEAWATLFPTQDLVDQYLVIDQKDQTAKLWYEASQFVDNVDILDASAITTAGQVDQYNQKNGQPRRIPSPQDLQSGGHNKEGSPLFRAYYRVKGGVDKSISDLMYEHRDKRMDATILRDGSSYMGELLTMNLDGNVAQGVRDKEDGGWYNTSTGYYWRKTLRTSYEPNINYAVKTNYHYVLARSGEAYMNLAEAKLLKKDITGAVEALNKTRTTHGGLPASTASTEKEAWRDYIRERRVEMAMENGDIYFSYLRWGKYGGYANDGREPSVGQDQGAVIKDLNRPVYKIQMSRDYKQALIGQVTLAGVWNRNFTARRYLFPIPQNVIEQRRLYGIEDAQNAGW